MAEEKKKRTTRPDRFVWEEGDIVVTKKGSGEKKGKDK